MMPTPQQRKKLQDALISAFPERVLLEQLLDYELDKKLNLITTDSNLQTIVYQLIQRSQAEEWLIDLVRAARKENPGNSELAAIALELLPLESSSTLLRSPSNSVTVIEPKQEQEVQGSSGITAKYDVFLAHNSADKLSVRDISEKLKQRRLKPWLDDEQIPPGRPFQDEIQQAIPLVKSAAILLGQQGLGRWQAWELRSLITQCVDRQIPVIPVLLPGVNEFPKNLLFLQEFSLVSFSNNLDDEQALDRLQWGITGEKPTQLSNSTEKPGRVPTFDNLDSERNDAQRISQEIGIENPTLSIETMNIPFELDDRIKLIDLLINIAELRTERQREQFLLNAGLDKFIKRIDLSGDTTTVVGQIITELYNYGRINQVETALGRFLITVKNVTGYDQQVFIDGLLNKYRLTDNRQDP